MQKLRLTFGFMVATFGVVTSPTLAVSVTLSAVQDATINQQVDPTVLGTGAAIPNNGTTELSINQISTTTSATTGGRAAALIQFDLSGIGTNVITAAHLEYYDVGTSLNQATSFTNETYFNIPKSGATNAQLTYNYNSSAATPAFNEFGIHEQNVTWNIYSAATGTAATEYWTETRVASMDLAGPTAIPANNAAGYYSGSNADSTAVVLLNNAKSKPTPSSQFLVVLSFYKTGARLFSDKEGIGANPVRLVLTTAVAGDFNNDDFVTMADYDILRGSMQGHLDGTVNYSNGDINIDGKVDLTDFGLFKAAYPGGAGGLAAELAAISVPEPSTLMLVGMAGFLAIARRRGR